MNKTLTTYLFLLGIITYVYAADINVDVGGPNGENIFSPQTVFATAGDNIVFTWKSGKHSIIESDAAKSCAKSLKVNAFTSGGAFAAPKTLTIPADVVGKTWFYCDVGSHCTPGIGGMEGTLIISDPPKLVKAAPVPGGAAPNPGKVAPAPGKTVPFSKNSNNTPILVGAIISALIGGILLTIGSFFLYKMFKRNKTNKDIMLIPGDNRMFENKYNHSDSNTEVYNDEQEANHGQEAISIPENNDDGSLKNYITQIVRQELKQK